jgi:hypothetical protein
LGALPSQVSDLVIAVDGAGQPPQPGFKGYLSIPYKCTINGWVLFADQAGSASFDVKWTPYSGFPTTTSIVGSANSKLVSQQSAEVLDVSALWTKLSFVKGDVLEFDLLSASTVTFLTLMLNITSD